MSDTRDLREGMADVNGDGVPDWVVPATGPQAQDDVMPMDDPYVLTTAEAEARGEDWEVAHRAGDQFGDFVDAPPRKRTVAERIIASASEVREPLLGRVFGSPAGRKAFRVAVKRLGRHQVAYWAINGIPWLVVRLWWIVRGLGLAAGRYTYWVSDREGLADIRAIETAKDRVGKRKDHKEEILDRVKASALAAGTTLAVVAICILLPGDAKPYGRFVLFVLAPAALIVGLVILGKPPEKKWAGERTHRRGGWSRLTAESVRDGLAKPKLVKDVADVRFATTVRMLAHGDLAFVQLPQGVTARDIMAKRDKLASGLGVLLNQCYPFEATKKHLPSWPVDVSTMGLLVTHKPVSEMDLSEFPRWPGLAIVAKRGRTDYFKAFPLMHDMLFHPVKFALAELNTIVAGRMGVGKSAWLQNILMYAALDPSVQLIVAEFKGVADFAVGSELYSDYVEGLEREDFARMVEILEWLEQELKRRGARIKAARKAGKAPKGKVTRELADDPNGGLWPILLIIDEFHMLSMHKMYGPRALFLLEQIIKRGRALAVHVVLATQIPNAKVLPGDIMSSIGTAICGGVKGWRANNMVLGDGAYEAGWRATDLKPGNEEERGDAGFAWYGSIFDPILTHAYYPLAPEVEKVYRYAHVHLRGERVVGHPADPDEVEDPRNVIWDVEEVFRELLGGVDKAQWGRLRALMAERWPASYAHIKDGPQLSAVVRKAAGIQGFDDEGKAIPRVRSVTVKGGPGKMQGDEVAVNGCHLAEIVAAREAQAAGALPGQRQPQAIEAADDLADQDDDDLADDQPPATSRQARPREAGNVVALAPVRSAAWDDDDLAPAEDDDEGFREGDEPEPAPVGDRNREPASDPAEDGSLTDVQMAAQLIVGPQFGSASMLQRKMRIGWAKAQTLLATLEAYEVVGPVNPQNPAQAREVLVPASAVEEVIERLRGADEVP